MDNRQKILNLIGLATKAGKTASGEFSTEKAVKSGKAHLVIVSEEASDNTKKMFTNMCTYKEKISRASQVLGMDWRRSGFDRSPHLVGIEQCLQGDFIFRLHSVFNVFTDLFK